MLLLRFAFLKNHTSSKGPEVNINFCSMCALLLFGKNQKGNKKGQGDLLKIARPNLENRNRVVVAMVNVAGGTEVWGWRCCEKSALPLILSLCASFGARKTTSQQQHKVTFL